MWGQVAFTIAWTVLKSFLSGLFRRSKPTVVEQAQDARKIEETVEREPSGSALDWLRKPNRKP